MSEETPVVATTTTNETPVTAPAAETPPGIEGFPAEAQELIRSLRQEAAGYRVKNKELEPLAEQARKLEESSKTELQRANDRIAALETEATPRMTENLRLRVAMKKGLSEDQARRLIGETEEEMSADADALLSAFGAPPVTAPPFGRPRENLRGGSDPGQEPTELDPKKLAARVRQSDF